MKRFALSLLIAAIFSPMAGCVVHERDRVVERRPEVIREEVRHDDRPVYVDHSHDHDDRGIRVDVHP